MIKENSLKWHYYVGDGEVIRVKSYSKPYKRIVSTAFWDVEKFDGKRWITPFFPRVNWDVLKDKQYIGKVRIEESITG